MSSRPLLQSASCPASLFRLGAIAMCLPLCACSTLQSAEHWVFGGPDDAKPASAAAAPKATAAPAAPTAAATAADRDAFPGKYNWIRIENSEPGGRSALPVNVDPDRLKTALAELKGLGGALGTHPLFTRSELDELCPDLALRLSQAKPGQDVTFAITGKQSGVGLFETEAVTTGRMFVDEGRLQLILGMTRINFGDQLRGEGMLRPFVAGQRAAARAEASPVGGPSWQQAGGRRDWLSIDARLLLPVAMTVPGLGSATQPMLAPAPAAAPAATSAPGAGAADGGVTAERRLNTLQRLRDKGLISEQEFQERRKAVLDGL